MKTAQELKQQADRLTAQRGRDEKENNRLRAQLKRLYTAINYLKSNPSQAFLEKELTHLNNRLNVIGDGFAVWYDQNRKYGYKDPHQKYSSEMGESGIRKKIQFIKFLLEE